LADLREREDKIAAELELQLEIESAEIIDRRESEIDQLERD